MAPPDQAYDDRFLTQYLLGVLPPDDAESMDLLCISDEELATRLGAIENDLVDAYVRGDLAADDLSAFRSFYLASPHRRQKVEFAAALIAVEKKRATAPVATPVAEPVAAPMITPPRVVSSPAPKPVVELTPERKPSSPRPMFRWGFALAAAAVVLLAYMALDNLRLRRQIRNVEAEHSMVEQTQQQLQKEIDAQRSASAESAKELERLRQSQTNQLKTVALVLPPPTRGAARPPAIILEPKTDMAILLLTLEADDFPQYRADLEDPVASRVLWSGAKLQPAALGDKKIVSVSFPAGLLKQQNYVVELMGLPTHGAPETIGSYSLRVVLR